MCMRRIWRAWPRRSRTAAGSAVDARRHEKAAACFRVAAGWWRAPLITCASTEMLLNEGEYDSVRVLAPHTVRTDDLGRAAARGRLCRSRALARMRRYLPDAGDGPGLRPRLCSSHRGGAQPEPGSVDNFYWTGALGHDLLGRSQGEADRDPDDPGAFTRRAAAIAAPSASWSIRQW